MKVRIPESWYESSVQFSHSVMSDSLRPHGLQHARLLCPLPAPGACSNSCQLSWWCHPIISSSIVSFSSCFQFFPASGSFPVSQFFASGAQSIGVSTLASVLPMNIQDLFPLRLTGFISLWSNFFFFLIMDSVSERFTNGSLIVCPRKPNLSFLHFYLAIWFWCILGSHLDERSSLGLEASFSSHTYYINPVMYNDYLCSVPQLVLSVSPFSLLLLLFGRSLRRSKLEIL